VQLLEQLASGDPETWNEAFRCLYPVAFEAARTRLGDGLNGECEDVAMETLAEILKKGVQVNSEQELKPLTAAIARNKATDRLRRHLAEKRGGNKVQSLEELVEANAGELPDVPHTEFVDQLAIQELRDLLAELSAEVKKEYRVVLRDHFLDQLSYNEIAVKRKISVGSVGVYIQRGLTNLRNVIARRPKLQSEFLAMLSDASVVKVLLPLISAVQLGGWFFEHLVRHSLVRYRMLENSEENISDDERLNMLREELPESRTLDEVGRSNLREKLKQKYPEQVKLWQQQQQEHIQHEAIAKRRYKRSIMRNRIIAVLVLLFVAYGIVRFMLWLL
jgi:RNA polymerase sigma factor (sigma-70 family)